MHIIERYNFGKEKLIFDHSFFENIIFTDECKFSNNPDSLMIYRKRGNYGSQFCSEFEKIPISCIAWGAIGYNFKPDLYFFESNINSEVYMDMLKKQDFLIMLNIILKAQIFISNKMVQNAT